MLKNLVKQSLTLLFSEKTILFRHSGAGGVRLTFDDGPHPEFTPRILDILQEHDVKAVFFLVGSNAGRHPEIVRRMISEGHTIGSHSFSHKGFGRLPWDEQKQEILKGVRVVENFDHRERPLFRPPQGRFNLKQIIFCKKKGITIMMWTVDSLDYDATKSKDMILDHLKRVRWQGGEIVLFHDDNQMTADVLPEFIRWMRSRKLEFAV